MSLSSKKANVGMEGIVIIVLLLGFAIVTPISYYLFTEINTDIQADTSVSNNTKELSEEMHTRFPSMLDGLFLFILILIWLISVISAFLIDTHPVFFILANMVLIFIIIIGAAANNMYGEFSADTDLASSFNAFPLTSWVMNNLIPVIIFIVISIGLALYGKNKFMGGSGI